MYTFLSDPKNAISKELDVNIPDNLEIKVHESDLNTVHLSLPPSPKVLNEGQLESSVAGSSCVYDGGCESGGF